MDKDRTKDTNDTKDRIQVALRCPLMAVTIQRMSMECSGGLHNRAVMNCECTHVGEKSHPFEEMFFALIFRI